MTASHGLGANRARSCFGGWGLVWTLTVLHLLLLKGWLGRGSSRMIPVAQSMVMRRIKPLLMRSKLGHLGRRRCTDRVTKVASKRRKRYEGYQKTMHLDGITDEMDSYAWDSVGPDNSLIDVNDDIHYNASYMTNRTTGGFQIMDDEQEERFSTELDYFENQFLIDMSRSHKVGKSVTLERRLNHSYLTEERGRELFDEYLLMNLPEPRGPSDEVDFWEYGEEYHTTSTKTKGDYAKRYFDSLGRILEVFTKPPYSSKVARAVKDLVQEAQIALSSSTSSSSSILDRPFSPLKGSRGKQWNQYLDLQDHRRRTWKRGSIFFTEHYVYQRLLQILEDHDGIEASQHDGYAEQKNELLVGAADVVEDNIEDAFFSFSPSSLAFEDDVDLDDGRGDAEAAGEIEEKIAQEGWIPPQLLRLCATAGRVDLLHRELYGRNMVLSTMDARERVALYNREKFEEDKKKFEEDQERRRREKSEQDRERVESTGRNFSIYDINPMDEDEEKTFEDYIVKNPKTENRTSVDPETFEEADTYFSYVRREDDKVYIADNAPAEIYGIPDYQHGTEKPSIFLRDDSDLGAERLSRSNSLLLLAGNAGIEVTMDLLLVDTFLRGNDNRRVTMHLSPANMHPSYATEEDVLQAIEFMEKMYEQDGNVEESSSRLYAQNAARRLKKALKTSRLEIMTPSFYQTPLPFWAAPKSFTEHIGHFDVMILKADRHYRRLTGDLEHSAFTPFTRLLGNVLPPSTDILALRPLNFPGTCIGLPLRSVSKARKRFSASWDTTGILSVSELINVDEPEKFFL
eukprot:jgi/Bigna1/70929/fgenesh1_pg.13_\